MEGFDCLGTHDEVGFDWLNFVKGGAGALQSAGGLLSAKQPGTPAATEADRLRLQMEKEAAERRAQTLKIVLIAMGSLLGVGVLGMLAFGGRRAPVSASK